MVSKERMLAIADALDILARSQAFEDSTWATDIRAYVAAYESNASDAAYARRYKQLCQNIIDAKKRSGHVFGLTELEIDACIDDAIKMNVYT